MNTRRKVCGLRAYCIRLATVCACLLAGCGGGGAKEEDFKAAPFKLQPPALSAVARIDGEPAGTNCPDGGTRISVGMDTNGNGALDTAEISSTQYLCNGARGPAGSIGATGVAGAAGSTGSRGLGSLVRLDPEPVGQRCANGGYQVSVGSDTNNDGRLDPSEVSSVAYACNGIAGAAGTTGAAGNNGLNGATSLVTLLPELAGARCLYGGTQVNSGLDTNRNGLLDASELTSTAYICAGPPGGIAWINVTTATQSAQANTGYLADSAIEVAIKLPSSLAVGDVLRVTGIGSGGWKILQNDSQWISTAGLPGNLEVGSDWTAAPSQGDEPSVAISSDGRLLLGAPFGGQLQTSTDGGQTWTARETPRNWIAVASSSDGSRLVAAVSGGALYLSSDSGVTWWTVATNQRWTSVASSADGRKLAATVDGGFIYVSSDYGQTWTPAASSQRWKGIAISADGSRLYATARDMPVFSSSNGGATWTPSGPSLDFNQIAISADGQQVATGAWNGQIYISQDYGATWSGHERSRQWVGIASSADGSRLVAGDYAGSLYHSRDHGRTWHPMGSVRSWWFLASSADGDVLGAGAWGSSLFTSTGTSKTSTGTAGSISGPQGAAIELQYAGMGRFNVLSSNNPVGGFTVR